MESEFIFSIRNDRLENKFPQKKTIARKKRSPRGRNA